MTSRVGYKTVTSTGIRSPAPGFCSPPARGRGFTLLELLVVLTIVALIYAVVPPILSSTLTSTEMRNTAQRLAAALRYTRNLAIMRHQEKSLVIDVEARSYRIPRLNRSRRLPRHIDLTIDTTKGEQVSDQAAAIRFFPDGSSSGGQITLAGDTHKHIISIDWLTGQIHARPATSP